MKANAMPRHAMPMLHRWYDKMDFIFTVNETTKRSKNYDYSL